MQKKIGRPPSVDEFDLDDLDRDDTDLDETEGPNEDETKDEPVAAKLPAALKILISTHQMLYVLMHENHTDARR